MELVAVILMLAAGGAIAVFVITAVAIAQREHDGRVGAALPATERERIASAILFRVMTAGGVAEDEALRQLRRAGIAAAPATGIDLANWGEAYARVASQQQRSALLETAVQLIARNDRPVPLRQYAALLDLSFSLGFQTDALAKLRERYGFEYIDHAKDARPREADRGGGATPLFVRGKGETAELLRLLGLEGTPTRQAIISAYRRLVAQHHPDKVFGESAEVQGEAARRFIELTRAYETLLSIYRD